MYLLKKLVEVNEESKGFRYIIDYAISFALQSFPIEKHETIRKEMENFVEKLYEQKI